MKNEPDKMPPKLAQKFLHFFLREDISEEVEGDLEEQFYAQLKEGSLFKATLTYWYQVICYFRPFAIRKSRQKQHNYSGMFRHNFLLAYRSFKRYKMSFFINLMGLSTGLTCALFIYLWVSDELSIDRFHENNQRLFQVLQNMPTSDGIETRRSTPAILGKALAEDFPEVEYAVNVIDPSWFDNPEGVVSFNDTHLKAKGQFVEKDYFNMFSWNILEGDLSQFDKNGVLISDEMAMKLFLDADEVIGKTIEWDQDDSKGTYHIVGIFQKPPKNSTAQFDFLFNYEFIFEEKIKIFENWGNSDPLTYVLLKEGANPKAFNAKIENYRREKYKSLVGTKYLEYIGTLFIQPYSDAYLYNQFENGEQAGGRITYVRLFSTIAVFILLIACINFMNLSTARASRRMKEIGIKKVVGVNRKTIIFQFLSESILITTLSATVALLVIAILLPEFNTITGKQLSVSFSTNLIIAFFTIIGIVGLLSGSYPAIYLSGFKPIAILKGNLLPTSSEGWIRKGLVMFQFTVSIMLIVSVIIIYKQIELVQTKNLGYNKDNIILFESTGELIDNSETFITEIRKIPHVINATSFGHDLVGDVGRTGAVSWEGKDPDDNTEFGNLEVDFNWFELLEIEMVSGRTFSLRDVNKDNIILNEAAIEAIGLNDPIGKTIEIWGEERQIIGVAKNFHFESLYEKVSPCFIQCYSDLISILVKIQAGSERETIEKIEAFHKEYNQGLPFDYRFLDQDFQDLYVAEQRVADLSQYFAGIAIIISCLGLFGLAAFTAERRLKEIGVRKVLGASTLSIIGLLSSDFSKMVLTAILIALPISYLIAQKWLESFAYRIDLEVWYFAGAGITALLIAWITVGLQTVKVANANPVKSLQSE